MAEYTKSQLRILKAANATFLALKEANPELLYYMDGSHIMTLNYADGSRVSNVRPDCSGLMDAIMRYMGYYSTTVAGSAYTGTWYGHTTNDVIRDSDGNISSDWIIKWFDPNDRQPGDILVTSGHTDMYVFTSGGYRGFNAGSGNGGQSIGTGMQYSVNLAQYYERTGEWTGGGADVGAYTIDGTSGITLIRYIGDGDSPASTGDTYTTNLDVYDVSGYQATILSQFDPTTCGGLIVQVCRIRTYGVGDDDATDKLMVSAFRQFVNYYKGVIPLGFYFHSYLPFTTSEGNSKDAMRKCLQFMESAGVDADVAQLGIWLHLSADGPTPSSKAANYRQVKWFREVVSENKYLTAGLFADVDYIGNKTSAGGPNFNDEDLQDVPIWVSWIGKSASDVETWAGIHGYQKVYLLQDSNTVQVAGEDVDRNKVLTPIPCGVDDYASQEGGVSSIGAGTYRIVPASKIIFSPTPGRVASGSILSIQTDARDARIYATFDNTAPNFEKPSQDRTGRRYSITRNLHVRAWAFDNSGSVLAKGAATYTIPWVRPNREPADEVVNAIREHQETNIQPYLEYHPKSLAEKLVQYDLTEESEG